MALTPGASIWVSGAIVSFALLCVAATFFSSYYSAFAHFFGETRVVDGFQIVFAPFPEYPKPEQNSTLNFSVLDESGANLLAIYSALTIKDVKSGEIVQQVPYRLYEISDMTFPYAFEHEGSYEIVLETRIQEHEKYQATPLTASYMLTISQQGPPVPLRQLIGEILLFYVAPASAAVAGILYYVLFIRPGRKSVAPG